MATSSSSTTAATRRLQCPLLDCPECHVPLIRIVSKQAHSKNVPFVKCPNNVKGDPTTCGWIRSEEQYAAWYVNQQKQRHMQVQSPFHSASGDVLGDLKQQVYEMKQTLDSVVEDLRSVKSQIGDKQDLGNKKKMQIVLDVYIAVGVLVGVVIGIVVARMMK